jgi:hypothetical protein
MKMMISRGVRGYFFFSTFMPGDRHFPFAGVMSRPEHSDYLHRHTGGWGVVDTVDLRWRHRVN